METVKTWQGRVSYMLPASPLHSLSLAAPTWKEWKLLRNLNRGMEGPLGITEPNFIIFLEQETESQEFQGGFVGEYHRQAVTIIVSYPQPLHGLGRGSEQNRPKCLPCSSQFG